MMNKYPSPERRKFKRVKANFIVTYKVNRPLQVRMMIGHNEVKSLMLNLSEGGMAFLTNYNLPAATLLSMRFVLINESAVSAEERIKQIKVDGEVRYSTPAEGGKYRLGICFTQISDGDQRTIADFISMIAENRLAT